MHHGGKRRLLCVGQRARGGEHEAARLLQAGHLGQARGGADGDSVGGEGGGEVAAGADLWDKALQGSSSGRAREVWGAVRRVLWAGGRTGRHAMHVHHNIMASLPSGLPAGWGEMERMHTSAAPRTALLLPVVVAHLNDSGGGAVGVEVRIRGQQLGLKGLPHQPAHEFITPCNAAHMSASKAVPRGNLNATAPLPLSR